MIVQSNLPLFSALADDCDPRTDKVEVVWIYDRFYVGFFDELEGGQKAIAYAEIGTDSLTDFLTEIAAAFFLSNGIHPGTIENRRKSIRRDLEKALNKQLKALPRGHSSGTGR